MNADELRMPAEPPEGEPLFVSLSREVLRLTRERNELLDRIAALEQFPSVERIAEALHRADISCEYADDGTGGAVCIYRRHPNDAARLLAALLASTPEDPR